MKRRLVSFDWAMKRLLRSKASFGILEGLLSELLEEKVKILEVLESEGNRESVDHHTNRIDLKVRNSKRELIIIEVQYDRQFDYLQRILYSTSKVITEHLDAGQAYGKVVKVISVNILYFDLGQGEDYLYHGRTVFRGLHRHDELLLSDKQREMFGKQHPADLFPEYYLIKVNNFDDVARTKLDEWIYFLKNEEIKDSFTAQGLKEAKQRLDLLKLPKAERRAYERYADELHYQASMVESSYTVPYQDGQADMVRTMIARGATMDEIVRLTGLTIAEIHELKLRPPSVRSHPPLTVPGSGRKWGKKFDIPLIRENPPPVFLPGNLRPFASSADGHSWFSSTINGIRSTRFRGKISVKNC